MEEDALPVDDPQMIFSSSSAAETLQLQKQLVSLQSSVVSLASQVDRIKHDPEGEQVCSNSAPRGRIPCEAGIETKLRSDLKKLHAVIDEMRDELSQSATRAEEAEVRADEAERRADEADRRALEEASSRVRCCQELDALRNERQRCAQVCISAWGGSGGAGCSRPVCVCVCSSNSVEGGTLLAGMQHEACQGKGGAVQGMGGGRSETPRVAVGVYIFAHLCYCIICLSLSMYGVRTASAGGVHEGGTGAREGGRGARTCGRGGAEAS